MSELHQLWALAGTLTAVYLGLALFLRTQAPKPSDPPRPISPAQRAELLELLRRGEDAAAMRRYREYSGASLVAAQAYVAALREPAGPDGP
ncbi:hypothetical protein [Deinococcus sp. SL84]|uniref:hypothetical protein n=1 Tax=Deinococcus sp. SL84 TaxID=2994663 RepID=UPI002275E494|nr:hypothetical protein [Deinococcus sp. SL84]MCY1701952.1 hypothetical protein [Deinococcus sp. SL84]